MDAFHGRWELRGGVLVPVPDPQPVGRPPKPAVGDWTPARLREAHARHFMGDRSLLVLEGERLYQRERKRAQRSGRMSPTDRAWAERNAVAHSWTHATVYASVANAT